MSTFELLLIAVGLAMDAFAVSICKGLTLKKMNWKNALTCGVFFGGFQAAMPIIGYFLGYGFRDKIEAYDHWIAFIVLSAIGISTIRGAFEDDGEGATSAESDAQDANVMMNGDAQSDNKGSSGSRLFSGDFGVKEMVPLAIATSIDALAVGVSFAFLKVNIWTSALAIGVITFCLATLGVKIGNAFGIRFKKKAELAGGIILILIGLKILMEHLGIIA